MANHHISAAPLSAKNYVPFQNARRSVTYHPTVWGDYFLTYTSDLTEISAHEEEQLQKQKIEVRKVLAATDDDSVYKMELIDAIQRLGVAHHFQKEIEKYLQYIYDQLIDSTTRPRIGCNDLHTVALRFRLLRQQGYYVSPDVFKEFKDHTGKFAESLINNAKGVLTLYEATHFGVNGEDILDEALEFCSTHLKSMVVHVSNSLATQINEALKMPIHKSLNRVGATKFMSIYQQEESHNEILLNFAKLDFNLLQKVHQKELNGITRWWKDLDFSNKLPLARDRMVECYFWALGIYFEPQYCSAREILSKVIVLASTIDDIYDVYGSFDDLQLFTDAIQRWNLSASEQLPPYMRICYEALLTVYTEMEELETEDKSCRVHYAKEEMKKLVRSYFEEAKWWYQNHMPTIEEYMKVSVTSSGYMMVATTSLVGMGNSVVMEDFDWVSREPLIVQASSTIARLMNDMAGHGFETKMSAVNCYMNQNGVSKEKAFDELHKQVLKAWKTANQECLYPTAVSMAVFMRVVNSARVIYLLYKDDDGYTDSKTGVKDLITRVLIEPATI